MFRNPRPGAAPAALRRLCGLAALLVLIPANSPANTPADPAAAFGARESVESIRLSPDGSKLAYVAPRTGQGSGLFIVDLASGESSIAASTDGQTQRLSRCNWVSNERLVCRVWAMRRLEGTLVTASRLIALDSNGRNVQQLGERESFYQIAARLWSADVIDWLPGEDGAVLLGQNFIPEQRQNTRVERRENGYGVVRVDTRTLSSRRVVEPRLNASDYISDGRGQVRIMGVRPPRGATGQMSNEVNFLYRARGSDDWRELGSYNDLTREGMLPVAVDPQLDAAYVFQKLDGRMALYRVALDGSGRREMLVSHPQVDVDDLLRLGRAGRVIGASYVTDRRQAVIFDPELRTLSERLSRAIPNLPLIRFVDSSDDENKLIVWAGSDTDPGRYFLYDRQSRRFAELMLARPQLEGFALAPVRAVSYRAADGTMIPAYLTVPPGSSGRGLPGLVMPHGGPGARDEWGFDWLAQYFANRGFAVLQPNFRGSAGYGDEWFRRNGFQSWRIAIGDVNDAGRWLVSEGIAAPERLAVFGWSYGGYAALQANVLDPNLFKAAVAVAPVTDLNLLTEEWRRFTNFAMVRDFVGSGPHVREGSPAQNASAIRVPVLMFHGEMDRNVGVGQSRLMRDRLRGAGRQAELVVFPALDHYLEDSAARAEMLRKSDQFLRAAMGMQ
jgi:dipeptidyl aminopeptidase/acylaminoacyl peptidase